MSQAGPSPVILIGAARSGTKYLRQLLAASEAACAVPYDVNYIWRTGNERHPDDRLDPASCTDAMARRIRRQLAKQAGAHRAPGCRFLVEKTVSNTLRVPFVHRVYPEARFIHLIRDGRAVVESSLRQWEAKPDAGYLLKKLCSFPLSNWRYLLWFAGNAARGLFGRKRPSLWGPRYPGVDDDLGRLSTLEICARQWERCLALATADLNALPSDQVFTIHYEQLVGGVERLAELADFLGLPDRDALLAAHAEQTRAGNDEKWRQRLDAEQLCLIESIAGEQLRAHGFLDSLGAD